MNLKLLFASAALAVLAGCAQIQAKINSDVVAVTKPDLENAKVIAATYGDADQQTSVTCFDGLIAYGDSLPKDAGSAPSLPTLNGFFSLAESARIAGQQLLNPSPALPPLDKKTEAACLLWLAQNGVEKAKLSALLVGISKGAGAVKAVKAAQALQAAHP